MLSTIIIYLLINLIILFYIISGFLANFSERKLTFLSLPQKSEYQNHDLIGTPLNNLFKIILLTVQLLSFLAVYLIYYNCTDEISVQNKYLFSLVNFSNFFILKTFSSFLLVFHFNFL